MADEHALPRDSQPAAEIATDGPDVPALVAAARARLFGASERDHETGQWTGGVPALKGGRYSVHLQAALEPLRREIRSRLLRDQGYTVDDAPETVLDATTDLADLTLFGESFRLHLLELAGVDGRGRVGLTGKGRTAAAFREWRSILADKRQLYAVLGMKRRAKETQTARDIVGAKRS